MNKLEYRRADGFLKSDGRSYVGRINDDIVDKVNELVGKVNQLEKALDKHKYGNTSSISPYDLSSRKRHINVY